MSADELSDAQWDEAARALPDFNVFQSSTWARHKADLGWRTRRLLGRDERGRAAAAAQLLFKRLPGASILWSRGGPLGEPSAWAAALPRALARGVGGAAYVRVCPYRPGGQGVDALLAASGWRRPVRTLNRAFTFVLDLPAPEKGLSGNWGHNLRRGLKRCAVRRWESPDPSEMTALYRTMEDYKNIAKQHDERTLRSLVARLRDQLELWRADDETGRLIAFRACAVCGTTASDLLAAASPEGRKRYASYALLWKLLEESARRGAARYDLGGADAERAKGVFDFKKGTGARPLDYIGERDWARPAILRAPLGLAATLKAAG